MEQVDPSLLHRFYLVPLVSFHKVVRHYAFANGIKVFTWDDLTAALETYVEYASRNN